MSRPRALRSASPGPSLARPAALLAGVLALAACRRDPPLKPPEAEPPSPTLPSYEEMTAEYTPLDLSPEPLPEGVAAAVDGEPILEADVERVSIILTTAFDSQPVDDDAIRSEALLQLVERRLLRAKADQMDVKVSEDELGRAVDEMASSRGITHAQLQAEVERAGLTWEQYRDELVAELLQMKVLNILGVRFDSPDDAAVQEHRARVVGCLRARAEVQVRRPAALPDNPFALRAEIGAFQLVGEPALPEAELRAAATEAAKTRLRLCDAVTSAELAVQELYLERGYLEANVQIPWPAQLTPPVELQVQVAPGRPHRVGSIGIDQSALPRAQRLDEAALLERLAAYLPHGQLASMSALRAANEEIDAEARVAGLGPVQPDVKRHASKSGVRLDITYRLVPRTP